MANPVKSDITIIGAGPAGIAAAITLGKKGIPCLLVDKMNSPKAKICGDGLSGKVLSTLNRIDTSFVPEIARSGFASNSEAVRFFSPGLKMMELSFLSKQTSRPAGFVCKRIDFDHFLLQKAFSFPGIRYEAGIQIEEISRKNGLVTLESKSNNFTVETSIVLLAAGSCRKLVRQLDPSCVNESEEGTGVRGYFENVGGSDRKNAIEIHFLRELLPWYLWIFPFRDGSANVGLALPDKLARKNPLSLKELLFNLINKYPHLKSRFANAKLTGRIEAGRLPFYSGRQGISGDNFMLLGDAARLIDPFTGEGIGNAMISGCFAAEIAMECAANNDFSRLQTDSYREMIYNKLGTELELGLNLQKLASSPLLLNFVIGKASRNERTRKRISRMLYDDNEKEQLGKTLFYLKLAFGL
jgi:geranylgeranyl reductase family protein